MLLKTDARSALNRRNNRGQAGRVLILGLGNLLLRDEGIGVHVAGRLQKYDLPDNVEVIDGGTAALDVLLSQQDIDKLVVIDAVRAGKSPGTIYKARFKGKERNELTRSFGRQKDSKISLHQVSLLDGLAAAERINRAPREIVIIGVEPERVDWGLELTEQLERRIPEIVNAVLEESRNDIHRE